MHSDCDLPFWPYDRPLADVLLKRNMLPLGRWLLGSDPSALLVQHTGSAWEAALSIDYLVRLDEILASTDSEQDLRHQINHKIPFACRWLFSCRKQDSSGLVFWDHVTWDTSVIIRAILISIRRYSDLFTWDEVRDLRNASFLGVAWLAQRFDSWDSSVKYPFGMADLAQILITCCDIFSYELEAFSQCQFSYNSSRDPRASLVFLIEDLVEYVVRHRAEVQGFGRVDSSGSGDALNACYWEGHFTTAETLQALVTYLHARDIPLFKQTGIHLRHTTPELIELVYRTCLYFEHTQNDGQWGSHLDTIRVVHAYVRALSTTQRELQRKTTPLTPELHAVFKALRWICDRKQIFDDSSFLHTPFLSVFLSDTYMTIYHYWEPARRRLDVLYDDVVWAAPVRTTPERARRIEMEILNARLNDALFQKDREIEKLKEGRLRKAGLQKNTIHFCFALLLAVVAYFSLGQLIGVDDLLIHVSPTVSLRIPRMNEWIAYTGMSATIWVGVLSLIWFRRK